MAITYTYKINNLKVYSTEDLTDIVGEVDYTYTASEGTGDDKVEASHDFMVTLNEPDKDNFKPFADLTAVSYTHLRAHETREDLVCRRLV